MKYRAVFFDMDGTVLDTIEDLTNAVNEAMLHYGYPTHDTDLVRRLLGSGAKYLITGCLPEGTPRSRQEEVLAYYKSYYRTHNRILTKPYAGVRELLAELQAHGVTCAVISNKPDPDVKDLGLHFFPGVYCIGERPGIKRKPDPESILLTLAEMHMDSKEAIYVGDSENDILAARNAGVFGVSVSYGFRNRAWLEAEGASCIVDSVPALREMLLSLCIL